MLAFRNFAVMLRLPKTSIAKPVFALPAGVGSRSQKHSRILDALERLVDPVSYGNPLNPLRWTTKSLRNLSEELRNEGFTIHHDKVGDLLEYPGYSLQQNRRMRDGSDPDKIKQIQALEKGTAGTGG